MLAQSTFVIDGETEVQRREPVDHVITRHRQLTILKEDCLSRPVMAVLAASLLSCRNPAFLCHLPPPAKPSLASSGVTIQSHVQIMSPSLCVHPSPG